MGSLSVRISIGKTYNLKGRRSGGKISGAPPEGLRLTLIGEPKFKDLPKKNIQFEWQAGWW